MKENIIDLSLEFIVPPKETIKDYLEEKNMTQEELAIRTGYSLKYIREVVSGKKDISDKFACALENALGVNASFWINLQGLYDQEIIQIKKYFSK